MKEVWFHGVNLGIEVQWNSFGTSKYVPRKFDFHLLKAELALCSGMPRVPRCLLFFFFCFFFLFVCLLWFFLFFLILETVLSPDSFIMLLIALSKCRRGSLPSG